jgi:hypothetical protein
METKLGLNHQNIAESGIKTPKIKSILVHVSTLAIHKKLCGWFCSAGHFN